MTTQTRGPIARYWEAWEQQFTTLGFMRRTIANKESPAYKALAKLWNQDPLTVQESARSITGDLAVGETFFWARPMLDVIEVAAKSIPDYTFDPTRLPAPHGWFWLERPLPLSDIGQQADLDDPSKGSVPTPEGWNFMRAVSWGSYVGQPRADGFLEMRYAEAGQMPTHIGLCVWQRSPYVSFLLPVTHQFMVAGVGLNAFLAHYAAIRKNAPDYFPGEELPHGEKMRYVATLFAFLDQRIFVTHYRENLPRHLRRAIEQEAEWQDLKRQRQDVRIVYLRRIEPAKTTEEQEVVEWKCRWLVRGHWRQQPYRSEGVVRPKWIHPFVKGPTGKPLKAPEKDLFGVIR